MFTSVPVLFGVVGSAPLVPSSTALAVFVTVSRPATTVAGMVAVTVRVNEDPAARFVAGQVNVGAADVSQELLHDPTVSGAGTTSVTTTPVASWDPTLLTVIVYVVDSPGDSDVSPSVLDTTRSGVDDNMSVSLSLLFAGVGSEPLAPSSATEALLTTVPCPAGVGLSSCTVTVTGMEAPPPSSDPIAQLTVPGGPCVPPLVADTKVVPAGRVSVSVTPVAAWLPVLVTRSV